MRVRQSASVSRYVYDGDGNRVQATVDGVPYTYDNRGNLTSDGTWTYTPWCLAACRGGTTP